jgi:polysaccharide biosynthesis protein VpsQ
MHYLIRVIFSTFPIAYILFIWWQSSTFNPSSLEYLLYEGNSLYLTIGMALELAHLFEFGLLYLFIIMAFLTYGPLTKTKMYTAAIISLLYGVGDEVHQFFIPYRSASFIDLLKNFIGVFVILYITNKYYFNKPESRLAILLKKITPSKKRPNLHI